MPQDLLKYVREQKAIADVPICEQEPAEVAFEIISAGSIGIYREVRLKQYLQPSDVDLDRHLQERYKQGPKLVFEYGKGFVDQSYEA